MDEKDQLIIAHLRKDARSSIKDIAKTLGMRPSTVHQRIQKLISSKVIEKFTIKVNDQAAKEEFTAFLLIKGSTQKYLNPSVLSDARVKEIFGVTGEYDLLIKLKFENVKEFNEYLISFRDKNPGVQSTLTMVGTAKLKEEI